MDFDQIFTAYYSLYRAEAVVPESTDDEYIVGLRLANEAVKRWANYDNTYWKELFNTLQNADDGTKTIAASTTAYDAPSDMKEAGGSVKIQDSDGNTLRHYPIIEPQEAQFRTDEGTYAYFTGNVADGFILNLNPTPDSSIVGKSIDYVYYKQPTEFESGDDTTEMKNPYFIVNRMLANRFRATRNPFYTSALRDAEDTLKVMKMENDSGTWANPWKVADNSGAIWGG